MSRALPCIAEPADYAGTGFCPLDCASGEIEIGPEEPMQPIGIPSAHCGGPGPADSVCEVYCADDGPHVVVVPEPDPFTSFAFGALLLAALTRC